MEFLIAIASIGGILFIVWLSNRLFDLRERAKKYVELKPGLDNLDTYKAKLESKEVELGKHEEDFEILVKEKTGSFPWLAQAYADYLYLRDLEKADYLKWKSHPAPKAAEQVREVASQRRVAEKLHRVLKYQLEYYENLFPWLVDFKGEDIDDLIRQIMERKEKGREELQEPDDPAKKWLTQAEYSRLPRVEKYQLALDRYWQKKKSKWEIGRDYERYIGYLCESKGYAVYYQGIVEGLADLGRDLICVKDNTAEVVQCKHWSQKNPIHVHEKHIFQLLSTVQAVQKGQKSPFFEASHFSAQSWHVDFLDSLCYSLSDRLPNNASYSLVHNFDNLLRKSKAICKGIGY
jgi:hypothetical protein